MLGSILKLFGLRTVSLIHFPLGLLLFGSGLDCGGGDRAHAYHRS